MHKLLYSCLWIFPFLAFLLGYQLLHFVSYRAVLETPDITGHHIHDAIKTLSGYHLNARILTEKEDADLPEGVVISQSPRQGQKIKAQQSVFLVVTRKPAKPKAPNFYGLSIAEAQKVAQDHSLHVKFYGLESIYPQNTCIAQNIQPEEDLSNRDISVYYSEGSTSLRIFPNFIARPLDEVIKFLKSYNLQYQILHTSIVDDAHNCSNCKVIEQQPVPGSLFDLKKSLTVQLKVKSNN